MPRNRSSSYVLPSKAKTSTGTSVEASGTGNEGSPAAAFSAAATTVMTAAPAVPHSKAAPIRRPLHHVARSSHATPTKSAADMLASASSTDAGAVSRIDPAPSCQKPAGLIASRAKMKNRMCTPRRAPASARGRAINSTRASRPAGRMKRR